MTAMKEGVPVAGFPVTPLRSLPGEEFLHCPEERASCLQPKGMSVAGHLCSGGRPRTHPLAYSGKAFWKW